jgi:putative transposase
VTDAVVAAVTAWQARPPEPMYPVVFFDALRVKMRDEAVVRSKAVYLALAVLPDGTRDSLGIWLEQTEGATFGMKVFTDLRTRGCHDILIAVTDGLKGMSEARAAVYPATTLQTCIVHLLRTAQHHGHVGAWRAIVATGDESIRDSLRGSLHGPDAVVCSPPPDHRDARHEEGIDAMENRRARGFPQRPHPVSL